jgi:hypothetical protein
MYLKEYFEPRFVESTDIPVNIEGQLFRWF